MVVLKRGELNVATVTKRELPTCKTFLEASCFKHLMPVLDGVNKRSVFCNAVTMQSCTKSIVRDDDKQTFFLNGGVIEK